MGSRAVVTLFTQDKDSSVPRRDRDEILNRYQPAEEFFHFLSNNPEMTFSQPLVQLITSRTECACSPAYQNHRADPARIPILEVEVPRVTLAVEIARMLDRKDTDSVCPNPVCQNPITHSVTTRFHDASEALIVSVHRKKFNNATGTYTKDNRPINVGQEVEIILHCMA